MNYDDKRWAPDLADPKVQGHEGLGHRRHLESEAQGVAAGGGAGQPVALILLSWE